MRTMTSGPSRGPRWPGSRRWWVGWKIRHGYRVTAFDVAPTAIARCRQRFPDSNVSYRVADLFALPEAWRAAFDLVVENRTPQSLPVDQRADAARAIAGAARTAGRAWVRCLARDEPLAGGPGRSFTAIYERAGSSAPWTARS